MSNQIDEAVKILNQGGIIIFPTDTAFGIGCKIDNEKAVERLFKIKKRPTFQAMPILVNGLGMAKNYVTEISEEVIQNLIKPLWPGALTIILKAKTNKVPLLVRGGTETVGVRMPNHEVVQNIVDAIRVPLLGPSANFHGENTPFEFKALDSKLVSLVDYVVKGECLSRQSSTVIDCTKTPWEILRQGAITVKI